MALAAPPSGGPWSVVAAVTGAAEESCTTALLLADGDINHAAELILSGVVVPVVTAVVTADSTAQKGPHKAAAAEKDRRLNLRPPALRGGANDRWASAPQRCCAAHAAAPAVTGPAGCR